MFRRLTLLAVLLATAACTGLREVRPGVLRSGQPSDERLLRLIDEAGIRTVVCLRRADGPAAASARIEALPGITFWNVPMSATRLPPPATLLELWRVAQHAERPLLLHCRAGVDRTGLASALLVLHDTGDLDAARSQLALLPHGHIGLFGTEAMDEVLERYAPHHGRLAFPDWVRTVYAADWPAIDPTASR
ncbi:MAG: tyrosine-protein phosphatase [Planctomycetota bacterium]